jgi:hypothetical protein
MLKLVLGPILGMIVSFVSNAIGMNEKMSNVLGLCVFMVTWWLNEGILNKPDLVVIVKSPPSC